MLQTQRLLSSKPLNEPAKLCQDARTVRFLSVVVVNNRLHLKSIIDVVGRDAAPEDLKLLTKKMTRVQKLRFATAVQSLQHDNPSKQ